MVYSNKENFKKAHHNGKENKALIRANLQFLRKKNL